MSRSRHRRAPERPPVSLAVRRRTLVGGSVLGLVLLTALNLAGSLSSRPTPRAAPPLPVPHEPGPLFASQPELEQAILKPVDLGGTHTEVPKATVRRVPAPERCSALLDPGSLLREAHVAEVAGQASSILIGPTDLSQVLASFTGDGADATLRELRLIGERCRDFQTRLDDGTQASVHVEEKQISRDTFALKLTLISPEKTTSGYVTLRRVGHVLSVLRELGTADVADPLRLVDMTLNRLTSRS